MILTKICLSRTKKLLLYNTKQVKKGKKLKKLLFILIFIGFSSSLFALPANVKRDQYMQAMKMYMNDKNYDKSVTYVPKLDQLASDKNVTLSSEYFYFKAKSCVETKDYKSVYSAAEEYVVRTGTKGRDYKLILEILNTADESIESKEERELQRQKGIVILKSLMFEDNIKNITMKENFETAQRYCEKLTYAEFSDWRLATKDELLELYTNKKLIQNLSPSNYWSSTDDAKSNSAWLVDFSLGSTSNLNKFDSYHHVRCVR